MVNEVSISNIKHSTVYVPKKLLDKLNLKNGDKVFMKVQNGGLLMIKHNFFADLDLLFDNLNEDLKGLFLRDKTKDLKK